AVALTSDGSAGAANGAGSGVPFGVGARASTGTGSAAGAGTAPALLIERIRSGLVAEIGEIVMAEPPGCRTPPPARRSPQDRSAARPPPLIGRSPPDLRLFHPFPLPPTPRTEPSSPT